MGDSKQTDDRVLRGGAWFYDAQTTRCAFRHTSVPGARNAEAYGLRPVAETKAAPESTRILRGGAWNYDVRNVRCAFLHVRNPGRRYEYYGLRPVAEAREVEEKIENPVMRGGNFMSYPRWCRVAASRDRDRDERCDYLGFRPVAETARPQRGFYRKYNITKVDGSPVDPDAQYLVLRLDTDRAACLAALTYADETDNPVLAQDLREVAERHRRWLERENCMHPGCPEKAEYVACTDSCPTNGAALCSRHLAEDVKTLGPCRLYPLRPLPE